MDQVEVRQRLIARTILRALLAATCLAQIAGRAGAQGKAPAVGIIDGLVSDTNLVSLGEANVTIFGTSVTTGTSADGRFRIVQVPAGEYILIVRRVGFHPASSVIEVRDNEVTRLTFALERLTPMLDTMRVVEHYMSGRLADYENRRRTSVGGQFITAADLEKRGSAFLADHLYSVRGVSVMLVGGAGGEFKKIAVSSRGAGWGRCLMQVVVDGMPQPVGFNLDDLPSPRLVAGMEIYTGAATIPLNLGAQANRWCGVIAVWTK